jgi:hypothetical protein
MNRHERRKAQKQKPEKVPQLFMEPVSAKNSETGEDELYLVLVGRRVAYRGHPGTTEAGKWISLVPEFQVVEDHPDDGMPVFEAGEIQVLPEPTGHSQ